ncbi:MAG: hypothetical protein CME38_19845 [Haliea sp.]|nr:hypothetical protein [Haliea sp.]
MPRLHELFTARVRDLASDGSGIVPHPDGQVFFVPGVWPGEFAQFRVSGFRKRHGFAQLVALEEAHPERMQPPCVHHGVGPGHCGGCPWQFMSYPAQLAAKEARVRQALAGLGLDTEVRPVLPSPLTLGYRNRAQLKSDGQSLGYVASNSRQLVDVQDCPILSRHNRETLATLRERLPEAAWRPARKQDWTTLDIDEDLAVGQASINSRRPFQQGNSAQNQRMRDWLRQTVDALPGDWPVVELFAGSGNFTEVLSARGFAHILAVEGQGEAIDRLAARNLPGVRSLACNLFQAAGLAQTRQALAKPRLLVLDPPRDGFALMPEALAGWKSLAVVLYIACDVATFRRDVRHLLEAGFTTEAIQPLDLFPHTPHVELMASFQRPMKRPRSASSKDRSS